MLVIRQAQIDTMVKGTEDEFITFVANHIKSEKPEITEERDEETLRKMVKGGIRRAESYDFSRAEDIMAFVSIMFEVAPNFDQPDEIRTVLEHDKLSPEMRLEHLWTDAVPEEAWDKAEKGYEEDAWFDETFLGEEIDDAEEQA